MRWYFTNNSIPELARLPRKEQRRLWQEAFRNSLRDRLTWVAFAVLVGFQIVGLIIANIFLGHSARWAETVMAGLICAAGAFLSAQILVPRVRLHLQELLPTLCRECGYDLTANASGRCPECGTPSHLRRAASERP